MADIASFTLHLRPTHADTIPAHTGRAAQAWFLAALRAIDPALSAAIHDSNGLKPFTISGLQPAPPGGTMQISPRQPLTLRLTTLHPDLTRLALNALAPHWQRQPIRLHDQPLVVERVETRCATYAELLATPPARRLPFVFTSPTLFKRTGDLQMPLPMPEYVFGSLSDRWAQFAPDTPLHPDLEAWVVRNVGIESHRLHTQTVSLERAGKGTLVGFVGAITFVAARGDAPYMGQLSGLAAYAGYAGVGAKTTIGFGQVGFKDQ